MYVGQGNIKYSLIYPSLILFPSLTLKLQLEVKRVDIG